MDESNIEFSTKSEPFRAYSTSPNHDFIQQRGNQSAMNRLFETDMFGAWREMCMDNVAVRFKSEVQTNWV
jgi:hypothetical protein